MRACYRIAWVLGQGVRLICLREFALGKEQFLAMKGRGVVLAPTHVSHLEPFVMSCQTTRHITWLARKEFYAWRLMAMGLHALGALSVNRTGVPARAIRGAIERARAGEIVGIFPEGGVQQGANAIFRGGVNKRGACLIAMRAGVPVLPVVMLGTEKLNRVGPWLPCKRARVYIAYGRPVHPKAERGRAAREEMARELQAEYVRTYEQLLAATGLRDSDVP